MPLRFSFPSGRFFLLLVGKNAILIKTCFRYRWEEKL